MSNENLWALILGGSSGIGLATAKKLADEGMNLCIVHRDRRGSMESIRAEFEAIRDKNVSLLTVNGNALEPKTQAEVLHILGANGVRPKLRLLLHSIAWGNLKPLAKPLGDRDSALEQLAESLGVSEQRLFDTCRTLLDAGYHDLAAVVARRNPPQETVANEDDLGQTIASMATSLLTWVQLLHGAGMFAADARVLALTSEANRATWRGYGPVTVAKGALEALVRCLAVEFAAHGIRCNLLQPGVCDTPALRLIPGNELIKSRAVSRNPFARLTRPEDVANVISLLCTAEASWINGALIRVDGGEAIAN
jgi:NAD(P)-dependent dehydrogenase (short-subunit alcohol dehydrogenase family)